MKANCFAMCILAAVTMILTASAVKADDGSISITYAECPATYSDLGDATIEWSTTSAAPDYVAVTVTDNNGSGELFAAGRSGTQDAPWIQKGHTYGWILWDSVGPPPSYIGGNQVTLGVSLTCN